MQLTDHQAKYLAHELSRRRGADDPDRLTGALADARVDLNPHQVDAALFAFRRPTTQGVLIADEVGLGKTIEAGLVLAQYWAERRRRLLVIVPANLRKQWAQELLEKFALPCVVLERGSYDAAKRDGNPRPFETDGVVLCSYEFARRHAETIRFIRWDLVVMDEAHRVRNVYRTANRTARELRDALRGRTKVLLTATPLQNNLLELYGLVSFLDEHAFADEASFREQYVGKVRSERTFDELKQRIAPFCHRTLRRQVTPYVRYTQRLPILQRFTPSGDETALYEMVSEYLRRDDLVAIPTTQRALTTMVLRKLLASSSYAIAGALQKMTDRLSEQLDGPGRSRDGAIADELADDYDTLDETIEGWAGDEAGGGETARDRALLRAELAELVTFRDLAQGIRDNSKGRALIQALRTGFAEAERLGAAKKAIIFTESRRTQDYLLQLLGDSEFNEGIVLFNGANSDPRNRAIYDAWLARHRGTDRVTGARDVDMRAALVDYFRDDGRIMIATEAGAEGINLQFCSLVVNYDLPWNPQRIEQRIGRCHRYGQQHDVVVVNFLNDQNEADERVYELLREKFKLFEGVFGASDEVLGTVDAGIDFERQIAQIYQQCRTPQEIATAFARLQAEMSEQISADMTRVRTSLLESFDEEVTERLRGYEQTTAHRIQQWERDLMRLTRHELDHVATFADSDARFHLLQPISTPEGVAEPGTYSVGRTDDADHHYRLSGPLAQHVITAARDRTLAPAAVSFDYSGHGGLVTELRRRVGTGGWLRASRLAIDGDINHEDYLLLAATDDAGTTMDPETARRMLGLSALRSTPVAVRPADDARLGAMSEALADQTRDEVRRKNERAYLEEIEKLDAWARDRRTALRVSVKDLEDKVRDNRKQIKLAGADMAQVIALRRQGNLLQRQIEDRESELRAENRKIQDRQDELLTEIEQRLKHASRQDDLFTIRWELV